MGPSTGGVTRGGQGGFPGAPSPAMLAGMDKARRKELTRGYRERPRAFGVFAVRCPATGQAWVLGSKTLDKQENSLWFSLDLGSHPNKALQAAYRAHGRARLSYEPLESFDPEGLTPYEVKTRLAELEAHWRAELGAAKVTG